MSPTRTQTYERPDDTDPERQDEESDQEQSDQEQSDQEQSDQEQSDQEQSDQEQSDQEQREEADGDVAGCALTLHLFLLLSLLLYSVTVAPTTDGNLSLDSAAGGSMFITWPQFVKTSTRRLQWTDEGHVGQEASHSAPVLLGSHRGVDLQVDPEVKLLSFSVRGVLARSGPGAARLLKPEESVDDHQSKQEGTQYETLWDPKERDDQSSRGVNLMLQPPRSRFKVCVRITDASLKLVSWRLRGKRLRGDELLGCFSYDACYYKVSLEWWQTDEDLLPDDQNGLFPSSGSDANSRSQRGAQQHEELGGGGFSQEASLLLTHNPPSWSLWRGRLIFKSDGNQSPQKTNRARLKPTEFRFVSTGFDSTLFYIFFILHRWIHLRLKAM
ncbi:unnamed protein product [Pleuronectes platessa]|uniref:Uncharacterized protein n=1 Tax=Pleuronectes platessa TaxID=8262 RepID=A0A9N7YF02_PLEPL|nr:unnamed protein product [Pleuronectes platessa]